MPWHANNRHKQASGPSAACGDAMTDSVNYQCMAAVLGLFFCNKDQPGAMCLHWDANNRHK